MWGWGVGGGGVGGGNLCFDLIMYWCHDRTWFQLDRTRNYHENTTRNTDLRRACDDPQIRSRSSKRAWTDWSLADTMEM